RSEAPARPAPEVEQASAPASSDSASRPSASEPSSASGDLTRRRLRVRFVEALLAFAAALLSLRLAAAVASRWRATRRPELAAWSGALLAYSAASAALTWGAAAGWDARAFRVYYLFGALLTAPLLGLGSLLLYGW